MLARTLAVALFGLVGSASAQTSPPAGATGASGSTQVTPTAFVPDPSFGAGNLVTNGDFELHAGPACNSNLANASLGAALTGAVGFGGASEIDVYTNPPCWGNAAHSGATKVGIHATDGVNGDAFSLPLAQPIAAGAACSLRFWSHGVDDFDVNLGAVEVGLSSSASSFGTLVASGSNTVMDTWELFTATFTAPADASFITFRAAGILAWIHLDEVSLVATGATAFCPGDGTGTACPCGNNAPPGPTGCLNSLGTGGALSASGAPSVSSDSLVLNGTGMPNSSALYFQGTQALSGGAGAVFGDGLRCAAGTVVRLGTKANSAGASAYPGPGDLAIHVRGACAAGDVRRYQVWYRNAAAFCTTSTYNLTNGLEITWTP